MSNSPEDESTLRSVPSFSVFVSADACGGDNGSNRQGEHALEITRTLGGDGEDFSFGKGTVNLIAEAEEEEEENDERNEEELGSQKKLSRGDEKEEEQEGLEPRQPASPKMYLATGLGVGNDDFGGGPDLTLPKFEKDGDAEEFYRRMVDEFPCHPLLLRNYAQVLQAKGDLHGAEDFYHRATLADPGDGEVLSRYAKIVWEFHHDQEKALTYFQLAVQAAPNNRDVLASYASFLWEIDDEKETTETQEYKAQDIPENANKERAPSHLPTALDVADSTFDADAEIPEENYQKMAEENPSNPLILRNYAQFLYQSKGDFQGAEDYFSRAILADPTDGESLAMYAKLVWQLHDDHDKASSCFERAIQATPTNSDVLAAYASFLWQTETDD